MVPPDYRGKPKPFIIGVAGGTSSGKSTVCQNIVDELSEHHGDCSHRVAILSQDSFYRQLSSVDQAAAEKGDFNFDHPDAFDNQLLKSTLTSIVNREPVEIPKYDFKTNRVTNDSIVIDQTDVVLVEGILVLLDVELRSFFQLKIFVDTDPDTRLSRRVTRGIYEHGRSLDHILDQYTRYVKPAFEEFCLPTKKYADVIIPRGAENKVAIKLISRQVIEILKWNKIPEANGETVQNGVANGCTELHTGGNENTAVC